VKEDTPHYQSLVETLMTGRQGRKSKQTDGTIAKHTSEEGLLSAGSPLVCNGIVTKMPPVAPSPRKTTQQTQELLSPQPNRPAPVLKSRIGPPPTPPVMLKI